MKNFSILKIFIITFFLATIAGQLQSQTNFIWGKQFGSDKNEYVHSHVVDRYGNIYITGKTTGTVDGRNYGKNDGFITKMDSSGNIVWSKQFGTMEEEDICWCAIDDKGNVYITGSTQGSISNNNFGKTDIFVIKYSNTGQMVWTKQFGTDSTDVGEGIYIDKNGFIYVTGSTGGKLGKSSIGGEDIFIMKLDSNGNQVFINQFGTKAHDSGNSITLDYDNNIFICGTTWGDLALKNKGFIDAFTGQLNEKGELIKITQFGSEGFDIATTLTVDNEKNIYVGGTTSGNFACQQIGEGDCFLLKMNYNGDIIWNNQYGTKNHDCNMGICLNPKISNHILISGIMDLPPGHAFIRMYKNNGILLWEYNLNSESSGKDISLDNQGNIYQLGLTKTKLFDKIIGSGDVFLIKLKLDKSYMNH